jgi:ribose 5-phosphate isomerase A
LHRGFALTDPRQSTGTRPAAGSTERAPTDSLAAEAVAPIRSGMIVGLGTGRTASRGIRALAQRVKGEGLDIRCVSTSEASERLAVELGLKTTEFALVERVDYLFDGADEVDGELRLLKGSGGAMTRERMVAWASEKNVYMVQESKLVERLGTRNTLGIAIMAFGLASIRAELRNMGLNGVCRRTINGELFITDNGNLILDVGIGDHDVEDLAAALNAIPGIIDHGLFLDEADEVIFETNAEGVERIVRCCEQPGEQARARVGRGTKKG